MSEKRTCKVETAHPTAQPTRVGVRHSPTTSHSQGGGYLQNCTIFKPLDTQTERDPRIDELKKMGLHIAWIRVAEEIGFDNFLKMWRVIDGEEKFQDERYGLLMSLRRYNSYKRHQRYIYIMNCYKSGHDYEKIAKKINSAFCEKVAKSYVCNRINDWYKNKHE